MEPSTRWDEDPTTAAAPRRSRATAMTAARRTEARRWSTPRWVTGSARWTYRSERATSSTRIRIIPRTTTTTISARSRGPRHRPSDTTGATSTSGLRSRWLGRQYVVAAWPHLHGVEPHLSQQGLIARILADRINARVDAQENEPRRVFVDRDVEPAERFVHLTQARVQRGDAPR